RNTHCLRAAPTRRRTSATWREAGFARSREVSEYVDQLTGNRQIESDLNAIDLEHLRQQWRVRVREDLRRLVNRVVGSRPAVADLWWHEIVCLRYAADLRGESHGADHAMGVEQRRGDRLDHEALSGWNAAQAAGQLAAVRRGCAAMRVERLARRFVDA